MINLNEERFEDKEVKIFNGGEAGVVKDCTVRVEKKTADDAENAPDYKLIVTDETGAEINEGMYKKDDFSYSKNPAVAEEMYVKKMKHLAKVFRVEDKLPASVASYGELLDVTMKACNSNQKNVKVAVAVAFGTEGYPNKRGFLEIDGNWGIQNMEDGLPRLRRNALTTRPTPDSDGPDITVGGSTDTSGGVADDWA